MALNLDHPEVKALAAELSELTGTSETDVVLNALLEARERFAQKGRTRRSKEEMIRWLREKAWSRFPPDQLGRRLTPEEEAEILGYGPYGV